jgi:hypothetical protein
MFLHKSLKVIIGPVETASFIDFKLRFLPTGAKADFSWEINVSDIQKTIIDIVVDCFLTAHQLIAMISIDLVNRVTLFHKWRDDTVQPGNLFFTGVQTTSGITDPLVSIQMCLFCIIKAFQKCALIKRRTAITDIGDMKSDRTNFFYKVSTMLITTAETA